MNWDEREWIFLQYLHWREIAKAIGVFQELFSIFFISSQYRLTKIPHFRSDVVEKVRLWT